MMNNNIMKIINVSDYCIFCCLTFSGCYVFPSEPEGKNGKKKKFISNTCLTKNFL